MLNAKKVPSVIVPPRILCAPSSIIIALTIPISPAAERLISEVAVSVFRTLSSRRCTPPAKTPSSRSSAW